MEINGCGNVGATEHFKFNFGLLNFLSLFLTKYMTTMHSLTGYKSLLFNSLEVLLPFNDTLSDKRLFKIYDIQIFVSTHSTQSGHTKRIE